MIVNPDTNRLYVAAALNTGMYVIDGYMDSVNSVINRISGVCVWCGYSAINPHTNMIYITTGVFDNRVFVIDGNTNSVIKTIKVGNDPYNIVINPNTNKIYVMNTENKTISVIDGNTNSVIKTIKVGNHLDNMAINPNTNKIYVIDDFYKTISVIDGNTNSVVANVTGNIILPYSLSVNQKTNMVYVVNKLCNAIYVIDGNTNSVVGSIPLNACSNGDPVIDVDSNTNMVYLTKGDGNTLYVIDGNTNSVVKTVTVGIGPDSIVGINAKTDKIYITDHGSYTVSVIDGRRSTLLTAASTISRPGLFLPSKVIASSPGIKVGLEPTSIAFNPNTDRVYVSNYGSDTISVIDGGTNSVVGNITVGHQPNSIFVNTITNKLYVVNSGSDTVSVIDGSTSTIVKTISVGDGPTAITGNPNTDRVYVANYDNDSISVIDGGTNSVVDNITGIWEPKDITIDPYANILYVANFIHSHVFLIDGNTNEIIHKFMTNNETNLPTAIAVNPSKPNQVYLGTYYWCDPFTTACSSNSYTNDAVYVNNYFTNSVIKTIIVGRDPSAISFNPKHNIVYIANSNSSTVSVLDSTTFQVIKTIRVGDSPSGIAINPATDIVYVANSNSGTVSVIDGSTNSVVSPTSTLTFDVNPLKTGDIYCNGRQVSNNNEEYAYGTKLSCQAKPYDGFTFRSWSSKLLSNSNNNTQILTVSKNGTLTANFIPFLLP
jgi:YVTN family beta-propeller protein